MILDRPAHGHLTAEGTEKQATHHMIMSWILVGRKILTNRLQSGAMVYNHPPPLGPGWPVFCRRVGDPVFRLQVRLAATIDVYPPSAICCFLQGLPICARGQPPEASCGVSSEMAALEARTCNTRRSRPELGSVGCRSRPGRLRQPPWMSSQLCAWISVIRPFARDPRSRPWMICRSCGSLRRPARAQDLTEIGWGANAQFVLPQAFGR